ncbi:hypothetical protein OXX69_000199 [Metschnikowia pulcherrima]
MRFKLISKNTNSGCAQMDTQSFGFLVRLQNVMRIGQKKNMIKLLRYAKITAVVASVVCFRHSLLWWLAANTVFVLYILHRVFRAKTSAVSPKASKLRKFTFLEKNNWQRETSSLVADPKSLDLPAINDLPEISQSLAKFTELIITEFVDSWFTKISASTLFQDSIRVELKHVYASLSTRCAAMDVPNLLVHKVLPILTDHYARFTSVASLHDTTYSLEGKSSVARKFGEGNLHEGVTMAGSASKVQEKRYLRSKVETFLPYLLSSRESSNGIVTTLLTEILACTVLTNVISVVCEGDFFNQMIVKVVGANLQHRSQVMRLRAALQQHTTQTPDRTIQARDFDTLPSLRSPISPECVSAWMTRITNCSAKERERLGHALGEKYTSLDPDSPAYHRDYAAISKMLSMVKSNVKLHVNDDSKLKNLDTVLAEPKHRAVFREFLRGSKNEAEVDFWQDIELMRAPLEGSGISEVTLSLEFSNKDDILKIHEKYFKMDCFAISESARTAVSNYVENMTARDAGLYQRARQALLELQTDLFLHMKEMHFPAFQKSSRFGDLDTASPKKHSSRRVASAAFLRNSLEIPDPNVYNDHDQRHSSSVSPAVIQAVESAFEKIMDTASPESDSKPSAFNPFDSIDSMDALSHKTSQASLFGDTTLPLDESAFGKHMSSSNRLSALFENESESDSDTNSVLSDSVDSDLSDSRNMSNSELLLAAPGDLSLAEKINVLDRDIENLSEQNEILLSLLKKAELTNNVAELKILRRSNASLEKEINSKELQKQQYIVQESDNSLYGKSKVKIQSCVFGKDESMTYVMYVIEVQKFSSQDPTEIVAGWIVARRFSQFHKLNEYLKRKYPGVNEIKFPKKNVPYLKFQKAQQIEIRKPLLEQYLQELLKLPDVCSDPAFRSFLSSENFHVGKATTTTKTKMDSILTQFYQDLSNQPQNKKSEKPQIKRNEEMLLNIREMERELKQFDEVQTNFAKVPFVKPISDLLLTVFNLSRSNWLRGRALLVILQQVLGSTIEKTITSQIKASIQQESRIVDVLSSLQNMLFPGGKFRESPEIRTKSEQQATRKEAFMILQVFMSETCAKIFGVKNTNFACKTIFEMVQNDYLNEHLMFKVLDEVLMALFPELTESTAEK